MRPRPAVRPPEARGREALAPVALAPVALRPEALRPEALAPAVQEPEARRPWAEPLLAADHQSSVAAQRAAELPRGALPPAVPAQEAPEPELRAEERRPAAQGLPGRAQGAQPRAEDHRAEDQRGWACRSEV